VVKSEVLAVSPDSDSLAVARRLNFSVLRRDTLGALGISSVTLKAPDGMSAVDALTLLRGADPQGVYDYAHIYNPSGGDISASTDGLIEAGLPSDAKVGMIDGSIERRHPVFGSASITVKSFVGKADGPGSLHGTAIASLLVGKEGRFSGYLPGAKLYAADVFGGAPDGGSAADIARALNWLAENRIPVTNVSLAGPPNVLLAAAVKAFVSTGHVLVAPVGNGGPAAPPQYPASYEGVIAVTSVDGDRRVQLDANRGSAIFAAFGVAVRAATLPRSYTNVTGTSYAAPVVTARIALMLQEPNSTTAELALEQLRRSSDLVDDGKSRMVFLGPPSTVEQTATAGR
jgi:subtilisin family serine protease